MHTLDSGFLDRNFATAMAILLLSAFVFAAGLGLSTWTAVTEAIVDADLFAITDDSDKTGSSDGTSCICYYREK